MADRIGFILYNSKFLKKDKPILINLEASRILSRSTCQLKGKTDFYQNVFSRCERWKEMLDKQIDLTVEVSNNEEQFIEIFQSGQRRYRIKRIFLANLRTASKKQKDYSTQCVFILERIPQNIPVDLVRFTNNWKLNKREIELVRLLLTDKSNKEIAHNLNLSTNTIKGYLRLLMRRLNVSSRAGIIACLLTGNFLP
jgi:DNA-binding CsgD family transcriptional regulator